MKAESKLCVGCDDCVFACTAMCTKRYMRITNNSALLSWCNDNDSEYKKQCFGYSDENMSEQTEELIAQEQYLYEQKKLLALKNEELTVAISYTKEVEASLKVEREINDFAVQTKYDLVALIDVPTREMTMYKRSAVFEKVGLQPKKDYDTATEFVLDNFIYVDDHENFKRLFLDNLIDTLNEVGNVVAEYRLLDTDTGTYRWKRVVYRYFEDSNNSIIQLNEDIHNDMLIKKELEVKNERLILNEQCFKALSEHTNKVVLEWDFETNKITAMSNFKALFGREPSTVNTAEDALSVKAVHEDDREVFRNVFKTIHSGNSVEDARFRVADSDGNYQWCSLYGLVIKDNRGKPFKAIGSLENIDKQLQREEILRQKAEKDQLTGLYNKATTEALIKAALWNNHGKSRKYALMIIDVDNFKSINDELGHLYGDMVLAELSDELRSLFRTSDVIGRVGGDEFVVMLIDFNDDRLLVQKAHDICNAFRRTYSGGENVVKISASVGIAAFPQHGEDYETLFKNADIALYDTKAKGKNNFTFYVGQQPVRYKASRTEIDARSGVQKSFKENRMEYIFKLLYESDNEGRNIDLTLQFITERFGFSRGYVFETDSSGVFISNTFEWCDNNISSQMSNMQNLPIDVQQASINVFREKDIFIIEEVSALPSLDREPLEAQNIKSMFRFGIMQKGDPIGFIGFDDCLNERVTTNEEIEELRLICNVFATFLTKQRTAEVAQSNYTAMLSILNNFEGYAYVVDCDTYEVVFENAKTRQIINESSVGKRCYKQYMHKDKPCEECPIAGLSYQVTRSTAEINNKEYGVFSRTTASRVEWINGKQNYLISSVDITEYKAAGNGVGLNEK